ncbi:LysR family transcriptional regulator [Achromobacter ruhlandii]|uniref:HTH-type transcriptional regulator GltR n=1 Tax=Achromobacter ruhlandii TaxID=72557 RepID=A0ABM8LSL2_9BURK|nr:LysR family transcriptional regulator [Achromobacter ruhlandii]AKP88634.1 putative LysR-family transcriptional regulator [Achromobacter xylosoxidans]AOU95876.1 LysR family transcriptional regulator [Achromobacter ruhlandii]MCZ8431763.1 LysR family transcriptional regulator [Achromobacter ruhlandii]MDC6090403.1 LysR family transcriptional regulator [Achromobacter ruhlandii]MDC6149375.1 LysR family transcriptional regulator [Achromobacter ruhlandii]
MDSRFLQTYVHVVELGSIAQAARHQGLTPATVQQRLRALEADMGSALIARSGRTVKPTAAGTRILERARNVLRDLRDLRSAATESDLPAGPLRLGATPTALTGIMPPVLRTWAARYPHIEIYIEPAPTTLLYSKVLAGELDGALLVHPLFALPKSCVWRDLRREPLVLVTPADMAVRDPLAVIAREPYIRYDRSVVGGRMADDYLRARDLRPHVRFELDGIDSIAKLVSEGLGVALLPDWATTGASAPVRRWPLPGPCPARSVGAIWPRSGVRSELMRVFVEMAERQAAAER